MEVGVSHDLTKPKLICKSFILNIYEICALDDVQQQTNKHSYVKYKKQNNR